MDPKQLDDKELTLKGWQIWEMISIHCKRKINPHDFVLGFKSAYIEMYKAGQRLHIEDNLKIINDAQEN